MTPLWVALLLAASVSTAAATITWATETPIPDATINLAAVVHNSKIFLIGGQDSDSNMLDTVHSTTDGSTWATETAFPIAISAHTAESLGSKVRYCSGRNSNY
jgi:hypothetical protein